MVPLRERFSKVFIFVKVSEKCRNRCKKNDRMKLRRKFLTIENSYLVEFWAKVNVREILEGKNILKINFFTGKSKSLNVFVMTVRFFYKNCHIFL